MTMKMNRCFWTLLIALSFIALLPGCDEDNIDEACVAGRTESCDCENEKEGVRTCKADTSDWGDCNCFDMPCEADVSNLHTCQACYCSEEMDVCYANKDCTALLDCVNDCDEDESCQSACAEQYQKGVNDLVSLLDCRDKSCTTYADCKSNVTDFSTCLECYCDDELSACYANTDCVDLLYCIKSCGSDTSCKDACTVQYKDGVSDFSAVLYCRDDNCSDYMD